MTCFDVATGWLIPTLGNIVPLRLMHLVLNTYLEQGWPGLTRIVIAMLLYLRQTLLDLDDQTLIMEMLSVQALTHNNNNNHKIPWEEIILSSRNVKVLPYQ